MHTVIAGTGPLGRELINRCLERGDHVRALAVSQRDFEGLDHPRLSTIVCDVTLPETLHGVCNDADQVISCIGITRLKSKLTHMDVDYHGNLHLLREAEKSGAPKFGFISPEGVDRGYDEVPLLQAKYLFEKRLQESPLGWFLFRAGGFYSDLANMGRAARKGPMFVIGSGNHVFTPVDTGDLAGIMLEEMQKNGRRTVSIGGPEDLSWNEICRTCFAHYQRKPRIIRCPVKLCETLLKAIRPFSESAYAMGKLIIFMSVHDLPSDRRGKLKFTDYLHSTAG